MFSIQLLNEVCHQKELLSLTLREETIVLLHSAPLRGMEEDRFAA